MSWLNKSLSQLTDVTSSISKFTEDVLAAEPPTGEDDGDQLAEYRRQLGTGYFIGLLFSWSDSTGFEAFVHILMMFVNATVKREFVLEKINPTKIIIKLNLKRQLMVNRIQLKSKSKSMI